LYFPGVDPEQLSEADKHRILADIDADLTASAVAVRALPDNSRQAVAVAHAVFAELASRLRDTPSDEIMRRRVRLSSGAKARVALAALVRDRLS
jgi:phytoene/squalene synthetase